ncbi:hypothetical protein LLG95_00145 [bacterium]|nr:hypothetical protein [bacterium]
MHTTNIYILATVLCAAVLFIVFLLVKDLQIQIKNRRNKRRRQAVLESKDFRDWIGNQVRVLRSLGFLKQASELSDEEIMSFFMNQMTEVDPGIYREAPYLLVFTDEDRVLCDEMEIKRLSEPKEWIDFLQGWARISRGVFQPTNIKAAMNQEKNAVEIIFDHRGERQSIRLTIDRKGMGPQICEKLNPFVRPAGYEYVLETSDHVQSCLAVVVTPEERNRLKGLGWKV